MNSSVIYVALIDEPVDVWCPVIAEQIDEDKYRIVDQPYDPSLEVWEFEPGTVVRVELRVLGGKAVPVAVAVA